jgi:hypothetical protein
MLKKPEEHRQKNEPNRDPEQPHLFLLEKQMRDFDICDDIRAELRGVLNLHDCPKKVDLVELEHLFDVFGRETLFQLVHGEAIHAKLLVYIGNLEIAVSIVFSVGVSYVVRARVRTVQLRPSLFPPPLELLCVLTVPSTDLLSDIKRGPEAKGDHVHDFVFVLEGHQFRLLAQASLPVHANALQIDLFEKFLELLAVYVIHAQRRLFEGVVDHLEDMRPEAFFLGPRTLL